MFNKKIYDGLMVSGGINPTEFMIRDAVDLAGGECGEVEIGTSRFYDALRGREVVRKNYTIPVFHKDMACYGPPVEFVHLRSVVEIINNANQNA